MKLKITLLLAAMVATGTLAAQTSSETISRREDRKNLVVKEWNTDPATKTRRLDRISIYNDRGYKISETEYANYGQRMRSTFERYDSGKVKQEVEYDDRDKPVRIRKYEYNEDGTKKTQYNYLPNGKLHVIKTFEYIFEDAPAANK